METRRSKTYLIVVECAGREAKEFSSFVALALDSNHLSDLRGDHILYGEADAYSRA